MKVNVFKRSGSTVTLLMVVCIGFADVHIEEGVDGSYYSCTKPSIWWC
jgi:hypothetical protein